MSSMDNGTRSGASRDPQLKRPEIVTKQLKFIQEEVLKAVWGHQDAWPFHEPVDAEALHIPEYRQIIKHPMDLGTIKKNLATNVYCSVAECVQDFNQMFTNTYLFNVPGSDITMMCQKLEKFFLKQMQQVPQHEIIFDGCKIAVEFSPSWKFKQKQAFSEKITQNGGTVAYAVSKQSSFLLLTDPKEQAGSYRSQTAQRYGVPVLVADFVDSCIENGKLVDYDNFLAAGSTKRDAFSAGRIMTAKSRVTNTAQKSQKDVDIEKLQVWTWRDASAPEFDEESYQLAKGITLIQEQTAQFPAGRQRKFIVIEIHASTEKQYKYPYRIFMHYGAIPQSKSNDSNFGTKDCRYVETTEEALSVYAQMYERYTCPMHGYSRSKGMLHPCIGSIKYREYLRDTEWSTVTPHPEVTRVVELFWAEAVGELDEQLAVSPENITLDQVEAAEAVLVDIRDVIWDDYNNDAQGEADQDVPALKDQRLQMLSEEFYKYLPHEHPCLIHLMKQVAQKQDLCQLLRDMRDIRESLIPNSMKRAAAKLFYLHCSIDYVETADPDYSTIKQLVERFNTEDEGVQVQGVYRVRRSVESERFTHDLSNRQLLLHASRPQNFVGILSRGLLMPKIVVDDYGGSRSDPGMLGDGLYFSDSAMTCAKYSRPSTESGSRFLLVHEVALGNCLSTYTHNMKCQGPPTDFHSLHGVRATQGTASDFRDDEYVVYHTAQQQMRYLVEFSCTTDKYVKKQEHLKGTSNTISFGQIGSPFTKNVQQQQAPNTHPRDMLCSDLCYTPVEELKQKIDLSDVKDVKDPLKNIQLGLVAGDQAKIVLKEVHIRAKMVDLVAKVVLLQSYTNAGKHAVEGKYVFAVDDLAVVSGFEAFINGKHVVGKVKEKEEARTEYKQAIKEGHGAYLMEQQGETPEVSTVSVGNLPPGASVLIKITYITELTVDGDNIVFSLPSRLATWKHNEVLNTQTQVGLDMAQVSKPRETSLQVAIEMPFFIESIKSPSHQIKIKKTETKALVALEKNKSLDNQFILQVALASVHSPRMWVERHPESDDSRACMLAFYPEFDTVNQSSSELVLLLDMSNSMSPEDIHAARKVLLLCLIHCPQSWMFNVVIFGTGFVELFPRCRQNTQQNRKLAFNFVQNQHLHYGNTEVYGALKPHFLLPASDGTARNIFLLSDGNIKNEDMVLQAVFENQCHTRIFTMGIGNSCNKHCMRKLAQNGAGAFTHFDPARKSRWVHSIKEQLQRASQPVLTSVDVDWEQFEDERKPLQAPQHISSLFNGSRLVVYGFVPNCTQATLKARIGGKEVSTLVSTSELCITTGKMLHQLTARSIIQDWEDGLLNKDKTLNAVLKRKRKNFIINMSKKFSIVSQFTSFVAVEKRSGDEINDIKPSLEDLVAQEDVDTLMYMGWEDAVSDEQPTAPQRVRFDEAMIQNAREEFDSLVAELDCLSENSYKDTHVVRIMELREIIETATIMQEVNEDEGELCLQGFETPRSQKEVDLIMPLFHDESPESTRTSAPSLKKKESVGPIVHEKVKEDRGNVAQSPDTGQSPIAMFGSSSQHTVSSETALFGGSTHASGSFRRSVFEASNEKSSQSKGSSLAAQNLPSQTTGLSGGGGLFGSPNQTTVSSGGGTFGSSSQSTALSGGGLFGSSNQTAGSSGGPFGSCCQSTASSGGGLFGSPNKTTASSAGGHFGSSNQTTVASGGGVFGSCNQTTASSGGGGLFGSPNQTTGLSGGGEMLGSSSQVSASSGEGGLFGSPNQTTALSGGGLFGSSNQTTAASGRGVFGSCNQTTGSSGGGGLFGSPNQTTGSSGGGLFGSSSQVSASSGERGLFGSPNKTTASSAGGLFGSSNQTTVASGGGVFGSCNQTTGSSGGGLFGSPNQTTGSSGGGGGLFGSSGQVSASSGERGLFGSSNKTTASSAGGLFGSSNQTTPSSGVVFGSCNQTTGSSGGGGLFGSPNQTTGLSGGGEMLGSSSQVSASSGEGGLFGSSNKTTASSAGGLFGSSNQTTPSSEVVFGSCNQTTGSSGGGGLLGSPNQTTGSLGGGGLFGSSGQVSASSGERGLFGSPNQTTASSGGGLFGSSNQTTAASGRGVFGSCNQTTGSSGGGGLFGSPNQTTGLSGGGEMLGSSSQVSASSGEGGLFGSPNKTTASSAGGLFGSSNQTTPSSEVVFGSCNQTTGSLGGGGLLGSPNQTTGSLGGVGLFGSSGQVSASSGERGLFGSSNKTTASSAGGLFGSSNQTTPSSGVVFGSCNQTTGSSGRGGLFGSPNQTTGLSGGGEMLGSSSQGSASSGEGGLFGSPDQTTASSGGGLFGSSNQTTAASGRGVFGSCNQTTGSSGGGGLFGSPNQTTGLSGGGEMLGSSSQVSASSGEGGLFGSPNKTTASSAGGLFGSSNQTTPSSEVVFGSCNQTTGSSGGGGLFGSPNQTTGSLGGGGLFGSSGQVSASSGERGLFGSPNQTTASSGGGLFGSSNQTTAASGRGVFGSCNQTTGSSGGGGLFGSPNKTTASSGGGLFGSSNKTTAASGRGVFGSCNQTTGSSGGGGLFGSPNQTTGSSGGGLFGSSSQVSASSGERGLFGSSNKTTASSAGGLFGSSNQTTPSSGVVFGSCNQTTASSGGGGLFGSPNQTTGSSGGGEMLGSSSQISASSGEGGLFGSPNKATASSGGGLFWSSNQSTGSPGGVCGLLGQGGLFGSSSKTTSSSGGGTFGSASQVQASLESNQPTTTSGEGALSGSSNQTTALAGAGLSGTSSRGGLFGSCNQTTGSSADQSTYPPQLGSSFGSGFSSGSQLTPPGSSLSSQPPQPGLSFDKQPSQTTSGFSFGSQSTHPGSLSREGLFGSPNQVTTSSGGGSLVGSADQTMASSGGGGLFGGSALGLSSQHTFPPSGGIFRSVNQVAGGQQTQSISSQSAFGFGSQPTQPAASSFGTPPSQSAFGYGSQPAQPAASSFGQTAASSFGQTAGSSCGTPPSQSAFRFGSQPTQPVVSSCGTLPSQSDFGFGSQPAQPAASSFGQTAASSFGQTAASSFGQTAASSCSTPPSQSAFGFGSQPIQPVASSFGTLPSRSACGFGSLPTHPTAPSFGTPSSQSAFGFGSQPTQPAASSFGQTAASSFGQTAASSFGTLPSQSTCGFGSQPTHPTAPSFGTHPSQSAFGFGYHPTQQVSSFGRQPAFGFGFQPRQQPPVFGRQPTQTAFGYGSQPAQSGYGFGSQPTHPTAPSFGTHPSQSAFGFGYHPTQQVSSFGRQPAFGFGFQPRQQPPVFGRQPTQTAFGYGSQPAQSGYGFGSQPTQTAIGFGSQPTQTATGFGSQPTQTETGFGSQPAQSGFHLQAANSNLMTQQGSAECDIQNSQAVLTPPVENHAQDFSNLFEKLKICKDTNFSQNVRMMSDDCVWLSFEEQRTLYYYLCLIKKGKVQLLMAPKTDHQSIGVQTLSSGPVDMSGSATVCSSKRKFEDEIPAENKEEDQVRNLQPVRTKSNIAIPLGHQSQSAAQEFADSTRVSYSSFAVTMTSKSEERLYGDDQMTGSFRGGVIGPPNQGIGDETPAQENKEKQALHQIKKPLPVKAKSNHQGDMGTASFAQFGVDLDTLDHLQPGIWWTLGPELTRLLGSVVERCHRELIEAGLNSLGESTAKDLEHLVGSLLVLALLIRHSPVCEVSHDHAQCRPLAEVIHDVFSDVTSSECATKPYWLDWKTEEIRRLFPDTGDGQPWYRLADQMGDMLLGHITSQRFMDVVGHQFMCHEARLARAVGYCRATMNKHKSICSMLELGRNWLDFVLKFI